MPRSPSAEAALLTTWSSSATPPRTRGPGGAVSPRGMGPAGGPGPYLDVPAPGNLHEVLVLLQGLVHLVVCHAVASQTPFPGVIHLGKNDKLGHVGHRSQLLV